MRSNLGPGGTLFVELDGVGVTWMLRPSAEGVRIVQHGGTSTGQHSGFLMVPERGFALTVLTNSEGGPNLVRDLFVDDWALRRFAGVSTPPAVPRVLNPGELAPYEGRYESQEIN
jgi:Beta-lactamase